MQKRNMVVDQAKLNTLLNALSCYSDHRMTDRDRETVRSLAWDITQLRNEIRNTNNG